MRSLTEDVTRYLYNSVFADVEQFNINPHYLGVFDADFEERASTRPKSHSGLATAFG